MILKNSIENQEKVENEKRKNLEFLATVSHEIRNPVNAIVGISELIKKTHSDNEREEYVERLLETCGNLLGLINNIMDLGKLESGNVKPSPEPIDLVALIQQHVSGHKTLAEAKGLIFLIHVDDRLPKRVLADQVKISQVILNLVSNSVKFTQSGSIIVELIVEDLDSSKALIRFSVKDSGIGIPPERLGFIFEPYNQGGEEINLSYGGTGLGLSISKEIVEILGGELEVKSREGEGSEFSFSLELEYLPDLEDRPLLLPQKREKVLERKLKLLIVDDNKLNILILQRHLEDWGYESKSAADGLSAVELVQQEEFDMILMDFHMPKLDGLSATEAIRELPDKIYKNIPIIGLTASTGFFLQEEISSCGLTDLISKPFAPEELLQKILLYGTRQQEDKKFSVAHAVKNLEKI